MLKIYLSGAISHRPIKQVEREFADAEKIINEIMKNHKFKKEEYEIKNPFKILKPSAKYDYSDYLKADIKELLDCDYLINIENEGWKKSKGAKLERKIAEMTRIKQCKLSYFMAHPLF